MQKRIIRLLYRKIIDASSEQVWDKYLFDATYTEFLMQSQFYNQEKKYNTYAELKNNVPDAEKLNFLVSASVIGYLKQLNETVPDILNHVGKHFLRFENYKFEIIDSDINKREKHRIAIEFVSKPLLWHDTIGSQLIVSHPDAENITDGVLTETFSLQPYLSIYSIKEA